MLVCLVSLALAAGAGAAVIHEHVSQITEIPATGPHGETVPLNGPLEEVRAMTVAAGHLWVAECCNRPRIDEFSPQTGAFEAQLPTGLGSDAFAVREAGNGLAEGQLYSSSGGSKVEVLNAAGTKIGEWTGADTPSGNFASVRSIAVDNSTNLADPDAGYVYVATASQSTASSDVVDVFMPEAGGKEKYVGQLPGPEAGGDFPLTFERYLAVNNANGDVVVAEGESTAKRAVDVYEPELLAGHYKLTHTITGTTGSTFAPSLEGVAVDGSDGDIYISHGTGEEVTYQFGPAGEYLGPLPVGDEAVAVGQEVGHDDVYVGYRLGEAGAAVFKLEIFGPPLIAPDVTTTPATGIKVSEATLKGAVNPLNEGPASCQFEWGTSAAFGLKAPVCSPTIEGNTVTPVSATITTLTPDTTYYYRLQASNHNGENPSEASQDQSFTTLGPGIEEEAASEVTADSATLNATVDPNHAESGVTFQYGQSEAYGSEAPAGAIGAGKGGVEVSAHVQGLAAGITYHYRAVVTSLVEGTTMTFYGQDRTLIAQPAPGTPLTLPDGRAWEMVTPPNKLGALIETARGGPIGHAGTVQQGGVVQAAASGDAVTYTANAPSEEGAQGFSFSEQLFSARGPEGWGTHDIGVPHVTTTTGSPGKGAELRFFSEDLSTAFVQPFGAFVPDSSPHALAPEETSEQTVFEHVSYLGENVEDTCTSGCFHPLVSGCPAAGEKCAPGVEEHADVPPGTKFGGVIPRYPESEVAACPPQPFCGPIFEGATPDGSHAVISSPFELVKASKGLFEWNAAAPPDQRLLSVGEGELGAARNNSNNERHAISNSGSRVFFTDIASTLFMRQTSPDPGETLQIGERAIFQGASADGSRVFYTVGYEGEGTLDECLVTETGGAPSCKTGTIAGEVLGVIPGVSEDGSWVYYVAKRAEGPTLYVAHEGMSTPIALLSTADGSDWTKLLGQTARVSPNGQWFAFLSQRQLTGYDNRDARTGAPDAEAYLYNALTKRLICASCDPSGALPTTAATLPQWNQYRIGQTLYQPRYLDDSGRLFFETGNALVPQDINGQSDVYEYEPAGVPAGSPHVCSASLSIYSAAAEGCVGLISSGEASEPSTFMDASETGGDVFFLTTEKLSAADFDNSADIYDAHECTSASPCLPQAALAPPPCSNESSCRTAPTPQPAIFGAPASATFSGAGDATSSPPAKATARSSTRSQQLAAALKACRRERRKKARVSCEKQARSKYRGQGSASTHRKRRRAAAASGRGGGTGSRANRRGGR